MGNVVSGAMANFLPLPAAAFAFSAYMQFIRKDTEFPSALLLLCSVAYIALFLVMENL